MKAANLLVLWRRLTGVLRRTRSDSSTLDREIEEEIRFHLEMETAHNVSRGLEPEEAARRARMRLGGVAQTKQAVRDQRGLPRVEQWLLDLRHGARSLRRSPAYAATAVLVLALGIGATTSVWSVADAVLFRPLPYPAPERLATFVLHGQEGTSAYFDLATFRFFQEHQDVATFVASVDTTAGINVANDRMAVFAHASRVSPDYFDVLGVPPGSGRPFDESELDAKVVVLSQALAQRLAGGGGDRDLVGETVRLGGEPFEVVGVMPEGFLGVPAAELWLPSKPDFQGSGANFQLLARLRPDVGIAAADLAVQALTSEYFRDRGARDTAGSSLGVMGLHHVLSSYWTSDVWMLLGAVALLLLVACANTAGLLLARLSARRRELAIRAALGGGQSRIFQLLILESLLIGLVGGVVGVALAAVGLRVFSWLGPEELLAWSIRLDHRVLIVSLLLSVASSVLFTIWPALVGGRVELASALYGGERASASGRSLVGRRLLVTSQVAVSLWLLVGAGLLVKTLLHLGSVDLGFEPDRVWVAEMSLQGEQLQESVQMQRFLAVGLERLSRVPGVERVAVANNVPGKRGLNLPVIIPEREEGPERTSINYGYVSNAYFELLGIDRLAGRTFDARDDRGAGAATALVNEAFVRVFFPSGDVVGRRIEPLRFAPEQDDEVRTIVGVVRDFKGRRLDADQPPAMYVPLRQATSGVMSIAHRFFPSHWLVQVREGADLPAGAIESAMREVSREVPLARVRPLQQLMGDAVATERFQAFLLLVFSLLAVLMAAAGLYGVVSFNVARRTREIGVRLALGAGSRRILARVLAEGLAMAGVGVAVGFATSLILVRTLESMIFEASQLDPATIAIAAAVLVVVAALASLQPALRAAQIDPATSFRIE